MAKKKPRKLDESKIRKEIYTVMESIREQLERMTGRSKLIKGTIYERRRKCGRPGCRCARGELHCSEALSISVGGKTRMVYLRDVDMDRLRSYVENHRLFRQGRAELVALLARLMAAVDQIETARRVEVDALRK